MVFQVIWFVLWSVLWAVYFMLDGFDLGAGILQAFVGKTDTEKRMVINTFGPFWDGNEVWLLTAGGATFAAFPTTYALMFSYLYTPLLIVLFALILRGVSFEFRGKLESKAWRNLWDVAIFVGSFIPALLFGVAFGNIFPGVAHILAGLVSAANRDRVILALHLFLHDDRVAPGRYIGTGHDAHTLAVFDRAGKGSPGPGGANHVQCRFARRR